MNKVEIYEKIERDLLDISPSNSGDTLSLCMLFANYCNNLAYLVEGDYTEEIDVLTDCIEVLQGVMASRLMSENGFYMSDKTGITYWYRE